MWNFIRRLLPWATGTEVTALGALAEPLGSEADVPGASEGLLLRTDRTPSSPERPRSPCEAPKRRRGDWGLGWPGQQRMAAHLLPGTRPPSRPWRRIHGRYNEDKPREEHFRARMMRCRSTDMETWQKELKKTGFLNLRRHFYVNLCNLKETSFSKLDINPKPKQWEKSCLKDKYAYSHYWTPP